MANWRPGSLQDESFALDMWLCRHVLRALLIKEGVYVFGCMCVCVWGRGICVYMRVPDTDSVECVRLSQALGCSPNWLCVVDRMLTEHIAQTGTPFPPVSSPEFVRRLPRGDSLLCSFSDMNRIF